MPVDFTPSPSRSLGVEIELGIVDRSTGELVPVADEVISALPGHSDGEHPRAKHELFLSTIELITGVCRTPAEARADLSETIAQVQDVLDERGLALLGGGVHPFADPKSLVRSPSERYDELVDRIQWPARRLQIHGVHFHVGVQSSERAIHILNHLISYIPHFIALSASSPFWESEETGLASVRTKIFETMPTAGLPSHFRDWAAFEQFIDTMIGTNSIGSVREIWWDLRPHVMFGTIEFRMCDGMATLRETIGLAALAQCLVEYLDRSLDAGEAPAEPYGWVARENKWRAARWGLDAELVNDAGGTTPIVSQIRDLVARLVPTADRLGCREELESLLGTLDHGASYQRQRAIIAAGGTLHDVVDSLVEEFRTDTIG